MNQSQTTSLRSAESDGAPKLYSRPCYRVDEKSSRCSPRRTGRLTDIWSDVGLKNGHVPPFPANLLTMHIPTQGSGCNLCAGDSAKPSAPSSNSPPPQRSDDSRPAGMGRGTRRLRIMGRVQAGQRHGGFATYRPDLSAPRGGLAR
jgi:hypothetical protein